MRIRLVFEATAITMAMIAIVLVVFVSLIAALASDQGKTVSADEVMELTPSAYLPAALRLEPTPTRPLPPSSAEAFL